MDIAERAKVTKKRVAACGARNNFKRKLSPAGKELYVEKLDG